MGLLLFFFDFSQRIPCWNHYRWMLTSNIYTKQFLHHLSHTPIRPWNNVVTGEINTATMLNIQSLIREQICENPGCKRTSNKKVGVPPPPLPPFFY
jgi:hypothetical protein